MKTLTLAQEYTIHTMQDKGAVILFTQISTRKEVVKLVINGKEQHLNPLTFIKLHGCGLIKRIKADTIIGSRYAKETWALSDKGKQYKSNF